jgi:hypothetical protein
MTTYDHGEGPRDLLSPEYAHSEAPPPKERAALVVELDYWLQGLAGLQEVDTLL